MINGKIHYKWSFSIAMAAMLVITRGLMLVTDPVLWMKSPLNNNDDSEAAAA